MKRSAIAEDALEPLIRQIIADVTTRFTQDTLRAQVEEQLYGKAESILTDDEGIDDIVRDAINTITRAHVATPEFKAKVIAYLENNLVDALHEWIEECFVDVLDGIHKNRDRY
jgi:hypothetical protein